VVRSEDRCRIGKIEFDVATLDGAVKRTLEDALSGRGIDVHFPNAWSIALANDDGHLCESFQGGRNYPDGQPVVWAMRWMRRGERGVEADRVSGTPFFEQALRDGVTRGVRHYFLGSTPETLERLQSNLMSRFPGIEIVGASPPPFKDLASADYDIELEKIRECAPHIVWIGLGTPKQDQAAAYMALRYPAIFACVGAAFDFNAGNLRAFPDWVQEAGLAWLFRFVQEPRRLWRRYTYGNAKFIAIVLGQLAKERRSSWS
jgi:N-acetylglucosaminyldiphosphoundecaprenol N-acetyl-beta-D-mannosaminyltransferase